MVYTCTNISGNVLCLCGDVLLPQETNHSLVYISQNNILVNQAEVHFGQIRKIEDNKIIKTKACDADKG